MLTTHHALGYLALTTVSLVLLRGSQSDPQLGKVHKLCASAIFGFSETDARGQPRGRNANRSHAGSMSCSQATIKTNNAREATTLSIYRRYLYLWHTRPLRRTLANVSAGIMQQNHGGLPQSEKLSHRAWRGFKKCQTATK